MANLERGPSRSEQVRRSWDKRVRAATKDIQPVRQVVHRVQPPSRPPKGASAEQRKDYQAVQFANDSQDIMDKAMMIADRLKPERVGNDLARTLNSSMSNPPSKRQMKMFSRIVSSMVR